MSDVRKTIVIKADLYKKLRLIQAKLIADNAKSNNKSTKSTVSFSFVIDQQIRKALKM